MLKMFLLLFMFLYVVFLVFLALREIEGSPQGDCSDTHVVDKSDVITGYMESDLMDRIMDVLSGLIDEARPGRVMVGRISKKLVEEGIVRGLGKVYLLYGTTSTDYGEQVIGTVVDFLRRRGIDAVKTEDFLHPGDKYHYIFVGVC